MSHQSMIDSISDKGSALASTKVKGKLNDLNAKYNTLCGSAQVKFLLFALFKETESENWTKFNANKFCSQQQAVQGNNLSISTHGNSYHL